MASSKQLLDTSVRDQFAALCYRARDGFGATEVLLLTSRDTGRWVIPKGWPMGDRPGFEVAEQEAFEEAGVRGTIEQSPLGFFHYEKAMAKGAIIPCRVQVHALEVCFLEEHYKEKHCRTNKWFKCSEAAKRVNEPQLKTLIADFAHRFLS